MTILYHLIALCLVAGSFILHPWLALGTLLLAIFLVWRSE